MDMDIDDVINSAHIHLETSTYRVHVPDSKEINIDLLEETRPDFVLFVTQSSCADQKSTSFLVHTVGDVDITVMAKWINEVAE